MKQYNIHNKLSEREFLHRRLLSSIPYYFLIMILIGGISTPSHAQWQKLWQFNAGVHTIFFLDSSINSNIGFVATHNKQWTSGTDEIWRTSNGGLNWDLLNSTIDQGYALDFTFKDNLTGWYCGITSPGPYKTTDGGKTWFPLNDGHLNSSARAIYYNQTNHILLLNEGGNSLFSRDEGLTWSTFYDLYNGNGFDFFSGLIGISGAVSNKIFSTIDGGLTWKLSLAGDESYQPLVAKNTSKCFAMSEAGNVLFFSDDYGQSFTMRYDFRPLGSTYDIETGCIRGDTSHLFIQLLPYSPMYSIDEGLSWINMCGPGNIHDTRFFVKGDSVFMGDTSGGLWLNTTGIGSNSRPQLLVNKLSVDIPILGCKSIDSVLTFTFFDSCNGIQATLVSASLQGSNNFSFSSPSAIPRTIHPDDSLIISYNPSSSLPDTAQLHLRFHLGWKDFDTTIQLFGAGRIPKETVQFLPFTNGRDAINGVSGVAGSIVVLSYLPDKNLSDRNLDSISFAINYNGDLLDFRSASTNIPGATVVAGLPVETPFMASLPITIRGNNLSLDSLQAIVNLKFEAMVARTMQTNITMTNLKLNGGDPDYANCILSADSSNASFTLIAQCGDSTLLKYLNGIAPMKIISIRPNPAQDEIEIDLQSQAKQDAAIEIRNALGAKVFSDTRNVVSGANSIRLDTKGLPSGMYLVRVGGVSQSLVISR